MASYSPPGAPDDNDVRTLINSVISTGKANVQQIGHAEILAFIQNQPGLVGEVRIDRLRGAGEVGASSGIVLFTVSYDAGNGPQTRDVVLRHAPGSDKRLYFEYDLSRQFRVQRALQGSGAPVPEPLWLDADGRWLGVPGYVMVAASGTAPHPSAFLKGPLAEASSEDRERMIEQIMKSLVAIHRTDIQATGLQDFMMNAPGESPMARLINWYWTTWEWVRLPQYERLKPLHRWLLANVPDGEVELMHGDSTLHNYLFDGTRLTAVLDWEMSSLGRAEADLALQCVGNQLFAAPPGSGLPMPPSEAQWLAYYAQAGGRPLRDFDYFKQFAAYLIIVAVGALQRNMDEDARAAQEPLLRPLWDMVHA